MAQPAVCADQVSAGQRLVMSRRQRAGLPIERQPLGQAAESTGGSRNLQRAVDEGESSFTQGVWPGADGSPVS
jgi:hypothetical protein